MNYLKRLKEEKPRLYEAASYLFFGALTTLVNWLVYVGLTSLLGLDAHPRGSGQYQVIANVSQAVAWVLSVLFAFFTNRRWVFTGASGKGGLLRELWLFFTSRALGFALFDVLLFNVFLVFMGDRPAKLIMNVFVIVFNYFASRFVVFRKRAASPGEPPGKPAA